MSGQADWSSKRIDAARKTNAVSDAVASALEIQLEGTMRERPLRTSEQAKLAASLLEALEAPATPKAAK
jgi:hypothetical protein